MTDENPRTDVVYADLYKRIKRVKEDTESSLTSLDGRATGLETRTGGLEVRTTGLETRTGSLEGRVTTVESTLGDVSDAVDDHETRLNELVIPTFSIGVKPANGGVVSGISESNGVVSVSYTGLGATPSGDTSRDYPVFTRNGVLTVNVPWLTPQTYSVFTSDSAGLTPATGGRTGLYLSEKGWASFSIPVFSSQTDGLVPAPEGTSLYLSENGWVAMPEVKSARITYVESVSDLPSDAEEGELFVVRQDESPWDDPEILDTLLTTSNLSDAPATTVSGRVYDVYTASDGRMRVHVPWTDTDTDTTYSEFTASAKGLVPSPGGQTGVYLSESGWASVSTIPVQENVLTTTNLSDAPTVEVELRRYPVFKESDGKLTVQVPWSDPDVFSDTEDGLVPSTGSDTDVYLTEDGWRTLADRGILTSDDLASAPSASLVTGREYSVYIRNGGLKVHVPWVAGDSSTTYDVFSTEADGLVPKPASTDAGYLGADGVWHDTVEWRTVSELGALTPSDGDVYLVRDAGVLGDLSVSEGMLVTYVTNPVPDTSGYQWVAEKGKGAVWAERFDLDVDVLWLTCDGATVADGWSFGGRIIGNRPWMVVEVRPDDARIGTGSHVIELGFDAGGGEELVRYNALVYEGSGWRVAEWQTSSTSGTARISYVESTAELPSDAEEGELYVVKRDAVPLGVYKASEWSSENGGGGYIQFDNGLAYQWDAFRVSSSDVQTWTFPAGGFLSANDYVAFVSTHDYAQSNLWSYHARILTKSATGLTWKAQGGSQGNAVTQSCIYSLFAVGRWRS